MMVYKSTATSGLSCWSTNLICNLDITPHYGQISLRMVWCDIRSVSIKAAWHHWTFSSSYSKCNRYLGDKSLRKLIALSICAWYCAIFCRCLQDWICIHLATDLPFLQVLNFKISTYFKQDLIHHKTHYREAANWKKYCYRCLFQKRWKFSDCLLYVRHQRTTQYFLFQSICIVRLPLTSTVDLDTGMQRREHNSVKSKNCSVEILKNHNISMKSKRLSHDA